MKRKMTSRQRKAVMSKLTSGEKYFLDDCLKCYEKNGHTIGSRMMAKRLRPKVKRL